jgi:hypothetical protein
MFNGQERRQRIKQPEVKSLQVEVWLDPNGEIEQVNESAHLGSQDLAPDPDGKNVYRCTGAYGRPGSQIPVTFTLESLGTVHPKVQLEPGMHEHIIDVKFDALAWLDEPEKVASLSDAEKVELHNIGVVELNDKVLAALRADPRVWTAMADAALAIMQHASGMQEPFPKPIVVSEHDTSDLPGDHSDGAMARLVVGDHVLAVGDKYWRFCSHGFCGGRERYAFTWMDVPVAYLDEPK